MSDNLRDDYALETVRDLGKLRSTAVVKLDDADAIVSAVCEHMVDHGAIIECDRNGWTLRFPTAAARFENLSGVASIDVTAEDLESLYFIRLSVASHLMEFGPPGLDLVWKGDGGSLIRPPNFQRLTVLGRSDVTPAMRRITFHAEDASKFGSIDALHLNLILQQDSFADPLWPHVGANGLIAWERNRPRPLMRKYTVRSLDIAQGTIDIDFVLHSDAGPGSRFAEDAQVGDVIGVLGPGGGGLVEADWYLFAGDETALPAIARMLEQLPPTASATVIVEVENEFEVQQLCCRARLETTWLLRAGRGCDEGSAFKQAVLGVAYPDGQERIYVWVACEFQSAQAIRKAMKSHHRIAKNEHLVVSYWRRGEAELD